MTTTPLPVHVVEATADDVHAISSFLWEMWRQAGPDAPGLAGATEEVIAEIAAPEAVQARIGGPARRIFVAKAEDVVVGFAATRAEDDVQIELAGIVVLQAVVGRGIGTPLVEAAIASAQSHGFRRMTVSTEIDNKRALAFYEARGFEVTGDSVVNVEDTVVTVSNLAMEL